MVLRAGKGFAFGIATVDASGGAGGELACAGTVYSRRGAGGRGAIVLRGKTLPMLPADLPDLDHGNGSFTGGDFSPTRDGVSRWQDTGPFAPESLSASLSGNGPATLYLSAARTDPVTGKPDESTAAAWIEVTGGSAAGPDGRRWFRFRVELEPGAGKYPRADRVEVERRPRR